MFLSDLQVSTGLCLDGFVDLFVHSTEEEKNRSERKHVGKMKGSLVAGAAAAWFAREAAAQFAQAAMMRFQCSQLVVERLDPLVNPGMLQSTHLHQIVGGNSFNATMTPVEYDPSVESTCTTCTFSEDLSNYWTANLYFRAKNGSFKRVPQYVNLGLRGEGGITVYYIPPYDGKTKVTAFRPVRFSLSYI